MAITNKSQEIDRFVGHSFGLSPTKQNTGKGKWIGSREGFDCAFSGRAERGQMNSFHHSFSSFFLSVSLQNLAFLPNYSAAFCVSRIFLLYFPFYMYYVSGPPKFLKMNLAF